MGIAIIILTVAIRLLLMPLSLAAARTQRAMKVLEPKIKELKEIHKGDKEKEALETLALYKEAQINPFSSIVMMFIQIPMLLGLYLVFRNEPFSTINMALLYTWIPVPTSISLEFIGLISVMGKSIVLAVLAGATQYIQATMALSGTMKPSKNGGMQADFQKMLGTQLKYVFPFIIGVISYTTSGAIALYFITANITGSAQEWYVKQKLGQHPEDL